MNLDFFTDISLTASEVKTRGTIDTTPVPGSHLRLFKDGRLFPSEELVKTHNLEYVDKGEVTGNGFDIIDSKKSPHYPQESPRVVMIALVSKSLPKVDLFGSVGYNKDGTPKTSVLTQGSSTTGKWLITLLEEVYEEELFSGENRFVDLVVNEQFGVTTPNNIYQMPKTTSRGTNKGEITYQRRTDTTLWPLTVMEEITAEGVTLPDLDNMVAEEERESTKKTTTKKTSTV